MSEQASDETAGGGDARTGAPRAGPSKSGEPASGDASPDTSEGKAKPDPAEPRNDLIIEHWQAPRPDKMADSREIWEFESERVRPSGTLWVNLFAVILALAGALALIGYGIYWLASVAGGGGPELP